MLTAQDQVMEKYRAFNKRWLIDREALLNEMAVCCEFCGARRPRRPVALRRLIIQVTRPGPCSCPKAKAAMTGEERARLAARASEARQSAGLVGRLAKATFDSFERDTDEQLTVGLAVEAWAEIALAEAQTDKPWLLLTGKYGTGKSHLAAAILNKALEYYWTRCYFRSWTAHLARMRATFGPHAQGKEQTVTVERDLTGSRLLVLDDLDKANATEWTRDTLFTALDHRYVLALPTVITCNCEPEDLQEWTGPAMLDRMTEMCEVIRFDGPSYRAGVQW